MKFRAIIPSAGFGTRMNMDSNKSKEMLIDPQTNEPLIKWHLDLCKEYELDPLVITRQEKRDLIDYCLDNNIDLQIIKPVGEWPTTILKSESNWGHMNFLLLPDSRFGSTKIIQNMKNDLSRGVNSSIALHKVENIELWCSVGMAYRITEKPEVYSNKYSEGFAMGLIGFNNDYGKQLFEGLVKRDNPTKLVDTSFQYLDWFKDITRTGIIESYP